MFNEFRRVSGGKYVYIVLWMLHNNIIMFVPQQNGNKISNVKLLSHENT